MSVEQGTLSIDPAKKDEYLGIIDQAFDEWHKSEWPFVSKEYFMDISRASFLSYVKYLVVNSDDQGGIDLEAAKEKLKEEMGIYFREPKLENALLFLREGNWEDLL